MMTDDRLIELFLSLASPLGWQRQINYSPLIEHEKLLFHISGGVVFEKALVGLELALSKKIVTVQNCLRTDTWEKIGHSGKHHLSFVMLGHFMFFAKNEIETKSEMIYFAYEFLVKQLAIPVNRLIVTIHPSDAVTKAVWLSLPINCIRELDENVSVDPLKLCSGTRTEIIWVGPDGGECELWNIVFHSHAYCSNESLSLISADSGVSLDRLMRAVNQVSNDYQTVYWSDYLHLLNAMSEETERARYGEMLKTAAVLLSTGLVPDKKASAYVLRKIIREAFLLVDDVESCVDDFVTTELYWFGNQSISRELVFLKELKLFDNTLTKGRRACEKILAKSDKLSEADFYFLHDSHGLPRSLAQKQEVVWRALKRQAP